MARRLQPRRPQQRRRRPTSSDGRRLAATEAAQTRVALTVQCVGSMSGPKPLLAPVRKVGLRPVSRLAFETPAPRLHNALPYRPHGPDNDDSTRDVHGALIALRHKANRADPPTCHKHDPTQR